MRFRIYQDANGVYIKQRRFFMWNTYYQKYANGYKQPLYFTYVSDAERFIEKLKKNKSPELIKEL